MGAVPTRRRVERRGDAAGRVWFAIILGLLFALPLVPSSNSPVDERGYPANVTPGATVRILVPGSLAGSLGPGVRVVEAYDRFVIAIADDASTARLAAGGLIVAPEDTTTIHVNGYVFDTRTGVHVPTALAAPAPDGGPGYFLVQFIGPIKTGWRGRLEGLGVRIEGYVPNDAYVVRASPDQMHAVRHQREVQWTGDYHPAFRIDPALLSVRGLVGVKVVTFDDAPITTVVARLMQAGHAVIGPRAIGSGILGWGQRDGGPGVMRARIAAAELPGIARLDGVEYIARDLEFRPMNVGEQYVLQTNATNGSVPDARRIWDLGLRGEGEVIALADTGLDYDHAMFRHNATDVTVGDIYNVTDLSRRKVVRYLPMSQYVGVDPWTAGLPDAISDSGSPPCYGFGHGTSTASAAAGDDAGIGTSANDGMAPGAKLVEMDIGAVDPVSCYDYMGYLPADFGLMYGDGYAAGARIFSNSWGNDTANYTFEDSTVDRFVWEHPDALFFFAAGNFPALQNVGSPATSKNVVAVGAADSTSLVGREWLAWSSWGPTADGRRKPDLTTIFATTGTEATAHSDGNLTTLNSGESGFAGTSYASPLAAGMAALARQYFEEGRYPSGAPGGTPFTPSGAALKALLAASTVRMSGTNACPAVDPHYPNIAQGWGRLSLDEALYFPSDTKKLYVVDNGSGIATGGTAPYTVRIGSPGGGLRVLLAYSDYPALPDANPSLVNDLDLLVTDPAGTTYKGNVQGTCASAETIGGGIFDVLNNLEGVVRQSPPTGEWKIEVIGSNVPMGPQPFALVVLGDLVSVPPPVAPVDVLATLAGAAPQDVHVSWSVPSGPPIDTFQVLRGEAYDAAGGGYALIADNLPPTATAWDDVGAGSGDGASHFYVVRAVNAAGGTSGPEQAAKFARSLPDAGWNLISIPLDLDDQSLAAALRTLSWRTARSYVASDPADPWKAWDTTKGSGDLHAVSTGMALWVDVAAPGEFAIAGRVPASTTLSLVPGWNLVGYARLTPDSATDAFPQLLGVDRIEAFDSLPPYYLQRVPMATPLEAGRGYWVYAAVGGSWTVTN